jgi:hypothetical protein
MAASEGLALRAWAQFRAVIVGPSAAWQCFAAWSVS